MAASALVTRPRMQSMGGARVVVETGLLLTALAVVGAVIWEAVKFFTDAPDTLMPHVWQILAYIMTTNSRGDLVVAQLFHDFCVTALNALVGFILGGLLGFVIGVLIAKNRVAGATLSPLTVLAQTIPIVALAPALVLWLGTGWGTKVIIATYLSFFPLAVATARGFTQIAREREELFAVVAAGPVFRFMRLGLPSAAPMIFIGLENAASFAVTGAIVAELPFGSTEGLGVAILNAWQFYSIQPEALYWAAFASCLLGALTVVIVRGVKSLIPAARQEEAMQ